MSNRVSRDETNNVPDVVAPIAELMSTYPAPWAICGGWAIDSWIGRPTRDHGDVDITVFNQDHAAVQKHFTGWQLIGHDATTAGDTNQPWNGMPLVLPGHLHGRRDTGEPMPERVDRAEDQGFGLDVQLNDRDADDWVLYRDPLIRLPLGDAVQLGPWGAPTVAPHVLLFFKSLDLRQRDRLDFSRLSPTLTMEQRDWLRDAISRVPHPWLAQLTA